MKTKGRFGVKIPAILIVFALMSAIMVMPASATGEHDKGTISVANRATGDGQITVEGIADKCVFKDKRVFKVVVEIKKGMSPWEATQEIAKALNENAQFEKNYIARHSLEKPDVIITEREEHSAAFKLKITEMDKVESQIYYTTSQANITVSNPVGRRAAEIAKEELSFVKDDPNILAMTDAGYAIVGGKSGGTTTEACIDGVTASAGCTIGNGNLLLIHRSKEKPLWFAFFNNASGECVYLEVDNSVFELSIDEFKALPDEEVFTTIAKANIGADELFANPESWPTVFGGNEFSIITIANVWAKGAPYEFLKAAEFHNHICPGLTSGYIIIEYLDENLPLQGSQNYEIIACPPWCKDDAFQVIFDKTVGKRFVAMHLTEEDEEQLPDGVAGIYIRWDRATNTGNGLVLAFNWTKASEVSDIPDSLKDYRSIRKLKMDLEMMDYLGQPEMFVTVVKEFDLNSTAELMELKYAGKNPYEVLGLMEPYPLQEEAQRLIDFTWDIHDNTAKIADNETLSEGVKTTAEKIHVISHTLLHTAQYVNDYNLEDLKDLTKDPESNAAEINDTIFTIREYLGEYKNALDDAHELTDVLEGIVPYSHRAYAGATHDAIHNAEGSVFAILQLIEQLEEGL